jgi:hypothetical protein
MTAGLAPSPILTDSSRTVLPLALLPTMMLIRLSPCNSRDLKERKFSTWSDSIMTYLPVSPGGDTSTNGSELKFQTPLLSGPSARTERCWWPGSALAPSGMPSPAAACLPRTGPRCQRRAEPGGNLGRAGVLGIECPPATSAARPGRCIVRDAYLANITDVPEFTPKSTGRKKASCGRKLVQKYSISQPAQEINSGRFGRAESTPRGPVHRPPAKDEPKGPTQKPCPPSRQRSRDAKNAKGGRYTSEGEREGRGRLPDKEVGTRNARTHTPRRKGRGASAAKGKRLPT